MLPQQDLVIRSASRAVGDSAIRVGRCFPDWEQAATLLYHINYLIRKVVDSVVYFCDRKSSLLKIVAFVERKHRKKTSRNNSSKPTTEPFVAVWSSFEGVGIEFRLQRGRVHIAQGNPAGWLICNRIHAGTDHRLHSQFLHRDKIQGKIVKNCIKRCRANHSACCGRRHPSAIARFWVIDCTSRKIVRLPDNLQFAALSCYWGPLKEPPAFSLRLPERTSPVVENVILTTRMLDLHYLWQRVQ